MAGTRYCPRCLTTFAADEERCPNLGCGGARPSQGWGTLLAPGSLLDRHYRVIRVLAVGGAGLTYLAREIDSEDEDFGPELAIKVLYSQRDSGPFLTRLANEAQILQELAHKHIVSCRGFVHRAGHAPYLVTQFEHGGSLSDHAHRVGALSPTVSAAIVRQILLALDVAHQRGVVHRDLKPQNVLLEEPVDRDTIPCVRVADFGIAKVSGGLGEGLTQVGGFVGTPEYAAPEQYAGVMPTPATDIFAAGILLYFLLTEKGPFRFTHRQDIAHTYGEMLSQLPIRVPSVGTASEVSTLQEAIARMTAINAEDRATAWEILSILRTLTGEAPPDQPTLHPPPRKASASPAPQATLHPTLSDADSTFVFPVGGAEPAAAADALESLEDEPLTRTPEPVRAAPTAREVEPPAPEEPVEPAPLSLDDLLAPRSLHEEAPAPVRPPPRPQVAASNAPISEAKKAPKQKARLPAWTPEAPKPLPRPLPSDLPSLLSLLGDVQEGDRVGLLDAIRKHPPAAVAHAVRGHRSGGLPATGRGIGLAIAGLPRADLAPAVRPLLSDPDAGVRACGAEALGSAGQAGLLAAIQKLLADADPLVRSVALVAIARGSRATNRKELGRSWITPLQSDTDERVRDAAAAARALLDASD